MLWGMTTSAGSVVTLNLLDSDYCYGIGPLKIRAERIDYAHPVRYDGGLFYPVEGMELGRDGDERGRRQILVRGRCLPRL
jgi:hypothetical protein